LIETPAKRTAKDGLAAAKALFARDPIAMREQALDAYVDIRPHNDDALHAYIAAYYGYRIARNAVCPGHCAPFDGVADLFFMRNPELDQIWVGGRGVGKTLNLSIVEHLLLRFFGDTIANIGAVEKQALKLYSYIEHHSTLPRFLKDLAKRPLLSKTYFKNGGFIEVMPATMSRVNSPHTRVAAVDECDLCDQKILDEAQSIPIRVHGRPPQMIFTSSLKFAYGPMVKLTDEAIEKGRKSYTFCVFEVIEKCPPTRHREGDGCRTCPLAKECLDERVDPHTGKTTSLPGPGRAARSDGFMPIPDVIRMYQSLDADTWDSQWRCKRPSSKGLVYPQFGPHHVIDYMGKGDPIIGKYNPSLPAYAGVDFGFANATAIVYVQVTPDHKIVAFAEDFAERRISEDTAASMKREPWFANLAWIVGDPAALDARMTLQRHGVPITAANNSKAVHKQDSGISKIRWALAPQGGIAPFLYIDASCKNLLREMRSYHTPEEREYKNADERPVKSDDHAVDAFRYACAKLIRSTG
jgi:hypothetical protein